MKLLILVFRSSLEDEIRQLLDQLHVSAYTEIPKVTGAGLSGRAFGTLATPYNTMMFVALKDEEAARVESALKEYRSGLAQHQHGAHIPMHLYSLPCEEIL